MATLKTTPIFTIKDFDKHLDSLYNGFIFNGKKVKASASIKEFYKDEYNDEFRKFQKYEELWVCDYCGSTDHKDRFEADLCCKNRTKDDFNYVTLVTDKCNSYTDTLYKVLSKNKLGFKIKAVNGFNRHESFYNYDNPDYGAIFSKADDFFKSLDDLKIIPNKSVLIKKKENSRSCESITKKKVTIVAENKTHVQIIGRNFRGDSAKLIIVAKRDFDIIEYRTEKIYI